MKADGICERSPFREDGRSKCGCKLKPVIRVSDQGFDAGPRFASCPYEGLNSCGYLMWMDDEWQERSRLVIQKLAEDNKTLKRRSITFRGCSKIGLNRMSVGKEGRK
ncbi:hypothetical protein ZWY2020_032261 [Hordeum vulgare]|nr:hypothetical protein ZWY2020_032261 [Hordeum vulgare]